MLHVSALFEPSSGIHFKNYCFSVLSYRSNLMKILPVAVQLCPCGQKDGRRNMTRLTLSFSNFVNASERKNMYHAYEMRTNKVIVQSIGPKT